MNRWLIVLLLLVAATARADEARGFTKVLVESARTQIGVTTRYDPSYRTIVFPGGDVPPDRGVCSDVIIRAYRGAGIDLQLLVNRDMRDNFAAYPRLWHLSHPDPNIDHRRVPNLAVFLARHGRRLPVTSAPEDYAPGDIVTWRLPFGAAHIGVIADQRQDGRPLVIHNIGFGAQLEDVLFAFEITGHYRYAPKP
jgi:uncharacterized protein